MTIHAPNIYSSDDITHTYEQVHDLLITRYIIKTYSTNNDDIRDIAIRGVNFKGMKRMLELGCGYGFFIEKMKGLLNDEAIIIGIDMVENNREPFLHSVASIEYRGEFIAGNVEIIKKMKSSSFDCVVASYSLYFFPQLINEIARIMSPQGIFIVITHSRNTLGEAIRIINHCMLEHGIGEPGGTAIGKLFTAFPVELGLSALEPYFTRVERIDYINSMVFPNDSMRDLLFYLHQKRNLIYRKIINQEPETVEKVSQCIEKNIMKYTHDHGEFVLNKDDAVFRCYKQA